MANPKLVSVGVFLPNQPITNDLIQRHFAINADWIDLTIGNVSRHFSIDLESQKLRYSLEDMSVEAAELAIRRAGLETEEIDLLILSTATPDTLMPATVNKVLDRLGMNFVPTYQIQSGCVGAFQALDLGHKLLRLGEFRNCLVIGGDLCAKFMDLGRDYTGLAASELINFALFGDGAGAAVLSVDPQLPGVTLRDTMSRCEGLNRSPGQEIHYFGTSNAPDGAAVFEDYKAIERHVPIMADEVLDELLHRMAWQRDEIDFFLPPQLSRVMSDRIAGHLRLDADQCLHCVGETGNNGNALPFIQLDMLMKRIRPGQRALGVAIESSKWLKGGIALQA